ncbi:MAG: NAD(P)/FAD-dependent oxidoreductase [Fimbriimonadaceae bacterium]|nr:NAD(P)/FAD-dependent oxidoreductase [Fimbriimonadaceae bacterium]
MGGQLTALYPEKLVYDMPGYREVLAKDLARELASQGTQFQPELVLEQTAETLVKDSEGYTVVTRDGLRLPSRTLIVAAGAGAFTPTKIGVPREEELVGKGVMYGVRNKAALAGRHVVIVGGGDSAFDWCLNLEPIAGAVTLVHRRDQFRAHEDSVQRVLASRVAKRLFYVVEELHGDDHLEGVTIRNTQTKETEHLPTTALVVNVGFKSSLGPIKDWGFEIVKQQIVVDRRFETSLPGVFAVGDVCAFEGKLKLIATGVGEAATAVCYAKTYLDPEAKLFPGHSSEMDLAALPHGSPQTSE